MSKNTDNTPIAAEDDAPAQPDHGAADVFDWRTGEITPGPNAWLNATPFEVAKYRAALRNRAEAKFLHPDVTIPGGYYLLPDGAAVDANGHPVNRTPEDVEAELAETRAALPPRP